MQPARKRLLLFLACAVVLLAAGYGWGYVGAYNRLHAPELLLDEELVRLNFNNRLLHYTNLNQPAECRRELVNQLREQIAFVNSLVPECRDASSRRAAKKSLADARQVIQGQPLAASPATVASSRR